MRPEYQYSVCFIALKPLKSLCIAGVFMEVSFKKRYRHLEDPPNSSRHPDQSQ